MSSDAGRKKLAIVYGQIPSIEEIDQFALLPEHYEVFIVSSESICGYIAETARIPGLKVIAVPDYDEQVTYLPGLESILPQFDVVVVKERLGLYAYQATKARMRSRFHLLVWVDNLIPFPAQDVMQMRVIRREVTEAADGFLVQSKAAQEVLLTEGVQADKIHYFKPWVEAQVKRSPQNRSKALEVLGFEEGAWVIGFIGQLEWEEGLYDLVYACHQLIAKSAEFRRRLRIVFCGVGSLSQDLKERFAALGMAEHSIYISPSRDAYDTMAAACTAMYVAPIANRDRLEGDPFRYIQPMAWGVPVIGSRTPLGEETVGKHRLDFCPSSVAGLSKALKKLVSASALVKDIVAKNAQDMEKRFRKDACLRDLSGLLQTYEQPPTMHADNAIDMQILEIEGRVAAEQYVDSIDIIEGLFRRDDLATHHKSLLYRICGDCFTKLGDGEAGKSAYAKSIEIDPFSYRAYVGLGTVCLTAENYQLGALHFQKAVSLAPTDEMANLGLGLSFQGLGEFAEAGKWVESALKINARNVPALYTMVKLAYALDSYEVAIQSVQAYVNLVPDDLDMVYTLGGLQFKVQNRSQVVALMDIILAAKPGDARAKELRDKALNDDDVMETVKSSHG